jgi:hypothetical protein
MYAKSYYKRRKVGSAISNVIFRVIMFIVGVCVIGIIIWGVAYCFRNVNSEIEHRKYVP